MPLHGSSRVGAARYSRAIYLLLVVLAYLIGSLLRAEATPAGQDGTSGETIFQTKCVACHTIGNGKLVGPDLKDVAVRRDAQWLKSFIADPDKLFAANDPTAQQLLSESNNIKMPALGLTAAEVDALVAFLTGAGPSAGGAAAPAKQTPALTGDPAAGRRAFTGELALAGGGPSCIGCHTVSSIGNLGGGALGPELTHAARRYPGPGLAAVLGNIAFPTMVGPFANRPLTPQEQADLAAFLVEADQGQAAVPVFAAGAITASTWRVFGLGLAGAVALTILLALFWPRQRKSASARLRDAHRSAAD